jgi:uncharacterized protein YndB with AHSA1/START domain
VPSQSIAINAPQEAVFAYVADISKHGEWSNPSQKLQVEKTSEGSIGVGAAFKSTGEQFGKQHDVVRITEYVPNQKVVYESEGNAGLIRHVFEVSPTGTGVQLTKTFEAVKPKFPLNVMLPIINGFIQPGALKSDLGRIKANLEGS